MRAFRAISLFALVLPSLLLAETCKLTLVFSPEAPPGAVRITATGVDITVGSNVGTWTYLFPRGTTVHLAGTAIPPAVFGGYFGDTRTNDITDIDVDLSVDRFIVPRTTSQDSTVSAKRSATFLVPTRIATTALFSINTSPPTDGQICLYYWARSGGGQNIVVDQAGAILRVLDWLGLPDQVIGAHLKLYYNARLDFVRSPAYAWGGPFQIARIDEEGGLFAGANPQLYGGGPNFQYAPRKFTAIGSGNAGGASAGWSDLDITSYYRDSRPGIFLFRTSALYGDAICTQFYSERSTDPATRPALYLEWNEPPPPPIGPTIASIDGNTTIATGGTTTLTASVSGYPSPTYQWLRDGTNLSGATNASLTIANATIDAAGTYSVVATNAAGSASKSITISVSLPAPIVTPPTISGVPANSALVDGDPLNVTASILGTAPFTFVWTKAGNDNPASTTASLQIPHVSLADAGSYKLTVTNSAGTSSATLVLTVNARAPSVTTQPADTNVAAGQAATFAVTVSGTGPFAYQWQNNGTAIPGATNSTFTIANAQTADAGNYAVKISGPGGSIMSAAATLTVSPVVPKPAFVTQPKGDTEIIGNTGVFGPVKVSSDSTVHLQWFRGSLPISGETGDTLWVRNVVLSDSGSTFHVEATNSGGTTVSDVVMLTVVTTWPNTGNTSSTGTSSTGTSSTGTSSTGTSSTGTSSTGTVVDTIATTATKPVLIIPATNVTYLASATVPAKIEFTVIDAMGKPVVAQVWAHDPTVNQDRPVTVQPSVGTFDDSVTIPATVPDGFIYITYYASGGGVTISSQISVYALNNPPPGQVFFKLNNSNGPMASGAIGAWITDSGSLYFDTQEQRKARLRYLMDKLAQNHATFGDTLFAVNILFGVATLGESLVVEGAGEITIDSFAKVFTSAAFKEFAASVIEPIAIEGLREAAHNKAAADPSFAPYAAVLDQLLKSTDYAFSAGVIAKSGEVGALDMANAAEAAFEPLKDAAGQVINFEFTIEDVKNGTTTLVRITPKTPLQLPAPTQNTSVGTNGNGASGGNSSNGSSPVGGTATNSAGAGGGNIPLPTGNANTTPATLSNMSSRAKLGPMPLISGFVITGTTPKTVVIRGVGPSLILFGVTDAIIDPVLTLYDATGTVIGGNDNWSSTDAPVMARTGAFPLMAGSKDAAIVTTLLPGNYTVVLADANHGSGTALLEVYDAGMTGVGLFNLSTRVVVQGGSVVLPGIVISPGAGTRRVMIRAAGPALAPLGITDGLSDPRLTVSDGSGNVVAANDDWGTPAVPYSVSSLATAANFLSGGAFPFLAGSKDAAVIVNLAPGAYNVLVESGDATPGTVLVEIYDLTGK